MACTHFCNAAETSRRRRGAEDGIRTRDLRFTKPLLYQLSYFGLTTERGEHATRARSRKLANAAALRIDQRLVPTRLTEAGLQRQL